jgi:hypothetical protein
MEKPIRILPLSRFVEWQPLTLRKTAQTKNRAHCFRKKASRAPEHFRT